MPTHLQDANRDAAALGHGAGLPVPARVPGALHAASSTCPTPLLGTYFYEPSDQGYEAAVAERLERWREAQRQALGIETTHRFRN